MIHAVTAGIACDSGRQELATRIAEPDRIADPSAVGRTSQTVRAGIWILARMLVFVASLATLAACEVSPRDLALPAASGHPQQHEPFIVDSDRFGLLLISDGEIVAISRTKGVHWRDAEVASRRTIICAGRCPSVVASGTFLGDPIRPLWHDDEQPIDKSGGQYGYLILSAMSRNTYLAVKPAPAPELIAVEDGEAAFRLPVIDSTPYFIPAQNGLGGLVFAHTRSGRSQVILVRTTDKGRLEAQIVAGNPTSGCLSESELVLIEPRAAFLSDHNDSKVRFPLTEPATCSIGRRTVMFTTNSDTAHGPRTHVRVFTKEGRLAWSRTVNLLTVPDLDTVTGRVLVRTESGFEVIRSDGIVLRQFPGVVDARWCGRWICAIDPEGSVKWIR